MNDKDKLIENTIDLLELKKLKSTELFLKSIKNFKLSTERAFFLLFVFCLSMYILMGMVFPNTSAITIITDLAINVNTVVVPIFAVIITGYAIFQALANENTIITLLSVNHEDKVSKFAVYNLYFFGIVCCYLIIIIANFITLFVFKNIPVDWMNSNFSVVVNETIAAVCISFYFIIILNFLIEIKSFIYNLFQVFITSATASSISNIKKSNEIQTTNNIPVRRKRKRKRKRKYN